MEREERRRGGGGGRKKGSYFRISEERGAAKVAILGEKRKGRRDEAK